MEEATLTKAIQHAATGRTAIEDSRYIEAADAFGQAAALCHESLLTLYCTQTSALLSSDKIDEAKKVSESATRIGPKNGAVWYWYGMALFKLNQTDKAKIAFKKAASWETDLTKKTSYMDWVNRCEEQAIETIDVTMKDTFSPPNGSASTGAARTMPAPARAPAPTPTPTPTSTLTPASNQTPKDQTRMNWYQSITHVNIDIYAKNVIKEESSIVIEDSRIKFHLKRPNTDDYIFERKLFDSIVPAESTWNVSRFKFEARLRKARQGDPWRALDKEAEVVSAVLQAGVDSQRMNSVRKARNQEWKEYAEGELKDYKEDDSPMSLFRTIYKDADDDMRRAMMKSYSESGGKVLSTNWDDVRKKKVEYKEKD